MKILIVNGPNLNMMGIREPAIYGTDTYADLENLVAITCAKYGIEFEMLQSNHEGVLVDKIQNAYGICDGLIVNAAAYTHTSIAILDALKAVGLPTIEVHLSNLSERENFRQISFTGIVAEKTIMGKGITGYAEAILYLREYWLTQSLSAN